MKLSEWLRFWLDTYEKSSIKLTTYANYDGYIRNYFQKFDDKDITQIFSDDYQDFFDGILEYGLSAKTVRNMIIFLRKALKKAVVEDVIPSNPALDIELPKYESPEIKILSHDQQTKLIKVSYFYRYGVFVRLTLCTGIRLGELLGLQWNDIDFDRREMRIRRTLHRCKNYDPTEKASTSIFLDPPKTKNSKRTIPLLNHAVEDLKSWKLKQSREVTNAKFVVTGINGKFLDPKTFKDYYNRMLDRCDIHGITFHALRHTFATNALERGMDKKTLSEILGHYSVAFTLDTYAHVVDSFKRKNMDLMEDVYECSQGQNMLILFFLPFQKKFIVSIPENRDYTFIANSIEDGIEHVQHHRADIHLKQQIDIRRAISEKAKNEIAVFLN
jgi:integrase